MKDRLIRTWPFGALATGLALGAAALWSWFGWEAGALWMAAWLLAGALLEWFSE